MRFIRTIAVALLVSFTLSSLSFGQDLNSFKLATPSNFSSMKGPEFKEAAQIQAGILVALKDIQGLDIDSIKALGERQFIEKSVFGKRIEGIIHFNEASELQIEGNQVRIEKGSYIFRATTNSNKVYYALVSRKQKEAGYDISVVPEKVLADALGKGTVKFTHDSINKKDRDILNLYTGHEVTTENNVAIDEWIAKKMVTGEYAIDSNTVRTPLYQHPNKNVYSPRNYIYLLAKISEYLGELGLGEEKIDKIAHRMLTIPLLLIPYEDESELPTITIEGNKIRVYAHSSEFATYIFVPKALYQDAGSRQWPDDLNSYIERHLVHEIGVRCGLKADLKDGDVWNLLDEAVSGLKTSGEITPSRILQNLSPVNLLDLELRNDYAAGEVDKKGIFKSISSLIIAGAAILTSSCTATVKAPEQISWYTRVDKNFENASTNELIKTVFKESETYGKLAVSEYMGIDGNRKAIEPLLSVLENSKNGKARTLAALTLSRIVNGSDTVIVDRLISLLHREYWVGQISGDYKTNFYDYENSYVVDALGMIGDERAVPAIVDMVKSNPFEFKERAKKALIAIGPKGFSSIINEAKKVPLDYYLWETESWYVRARNYYHGDIQGMLADVLHELVKNANGETMAPIVSALFDKDEWKRNIAKEIVDQKDSVNFLLKSLDSKDPNARMSAAQIISMSGGRLLSELASYPAATECLKSSLEASNDESGKRIIRDAINAIRLPHLLYEYSFHNTTGYRPEDVDPDRARRAILEMGSFAAEKIIQIALYEAPYSYQDGAQRIILDEFKDDDVTVRKLMEETLLGIKTQPSKAWLLKELLQQIPNDRFVKLTQGLDEQSRLLLALFYFTNQQPSAEELGRGFLDNERKITKLYQNISSMFSSPAVRKYLAELDKMDTIEPEMLRQFIMAIAAAGKYPHDLYAPGVPQYGIWAEYMLNDMRIVELARNSTIVKLVAQMRRRDGVLAGIPYIEIPRNTWGDRYLMQPKLELSPVEFGKDDMPVLQRLLNSKNEAYRKAAARVLTQMGQIKGEKQDAPAAKPAGSSMLDMKPSIPEHIKIQMKTIGETIPDLGLMRFSASQRVDAITEILWKAGLGSVSTAEAKEKLAGLVPEAGKTAEERDKVYAAWIAQAKTTMLAMSIKSNRYDPPSDEEIRQIAARIKESGVEVFMPKSQFPGDTISKYKGIIEATGGKLRVYQHVEDLPAMIKDPARSIVMTVDVIDEDARLLQTLGASVEGIRFMNFAKMDDLDKMEPGELDNYEAEILSILLIARIITPEDFRDKGNSTYRMLSHLLEDYLPEGVLVEDYIMDIFVNAAKLIKTILKALPATAYKAMRQAVEVLWAA